MVPNCGLSILIDLTINQPKFSVFEPCVGFFDAAATVAQTFHFAAMQDYSALDGVKDFVVVFGSAILSDAFEGHARG